MLSKGTESQSISFLGECDSRFFSSQPGDLQLSALKWHSEAWTQKRRGWGKTHHHTFNSISQGMELCVLMKGFGTNAESSALTIAAIWKFKCAMTVEGQQKTSTKKTAHQQILYLPQKNSEEVYCAILPVFFVVETKFCKTVCVYSL